MSNTDFHLLATAIGSMPQIDPLKACSLIFKYLKEIPAWPQLPNRSTEEGMIRQVAFGFPALNIEGNNLLVKKVGQEEAKELYSAYLNNNVDHYPIREEEASGLYTFLELAKPPFEAVKGQLTGPVTFGLAVSDEAQKPIIYDDTLRQMIAQFLRLKAAWQEKMLAPLGRTIIFLDEPGMVSYGSAFFNLEPQRVKALINEVLGGLRGLKGIHCCGNTDWSILMETNTDIISFDSYNFPESLNPYSEVTKSFLKKGGAIAWGIVPTDEKSLAKEDASTLKDRLEETMAPLTRNGIPFKELARKGLLTPSCGLAMLSPEASEYALGVLDQLSQIMRKRYS